MGIEASYVSLPQALLKDAISQPEKAVDILLEPPPASEKCLQVSLDKAWHVLHVLLSGNVEADSSALGSCVLGGTSVDFELDYGFPRYFDEELVKKIQESLDSIDFAAQFEKNSNLLIENEEIYLGAEIHEEGITSVSDFFLELKNVFNHAALHNNAVLTALV